MPATPKIPTVGSLGMGRRGIEQGVVTFAAAAAPFTPTQITGCILWLDFSDTATITASGDSVSQVDDKSGAGNHATQGTANRQPRTGTHSKNTLNVLAFGTDADLNSNFMEIAGVPANDRTQSIFAVAKTANDSFFDRAIVGGNQNLNRALYRDDSGANLRLQRQFAGDIASHGGASITNDTWYVFSCIMSATTVQLGQNGTYETDSDSNTLGTDAGTRLGVDGVSNNDVWNGDIAEVVIYDNTISDADRDLLVTYLNAKWAVY